MNSLSPTPNRSETLVIVEEAEAAIVGQALLHLSVKQWATLLKLVEMPGCVKTSQQLSLNGETRAVKYVIRLLRRKLADLGLESAIVYEANRGYRFIAPVTRVKTITAALQLDTEGDRGIA